MIMVRRIGTVEDLGSKPYLVFVSDSQEVEAIKEHIRHNDVTDEYDSFFVDVRNGGYDEIYGMFGIVPHNGNDIFEISIR